MLKLDFMNKNYSIKEVIDAYTDGSMDNFKGDEDFLNFLISYSLGNNLQGQDAYKYKEYAKYEGILNIMRLDEYGYFGQKLYKIYEICGKDKINFIRVCDAIGQYSINHSIEKETIDKNLELKNPVNFIDDTIILSNGKKPTYNSEHKFWFGRYDLNSDEELEYHYELERSLRKRINESIKENKEKLDFLKEMPSYIDKQRLEKEAYEKKKVKDDHLIDINNLYFGTQSLDISGGVLGIVMKTVSWFEYTNVNMLKYHIFRSIPDGNYCLLDDQGKIYIPDVTLKNKDISIGSDTAIRGVQIANIPTIFKSAIKKLEEEPVNNEEIILSAKGLLELLENKTKISVGELEDYESIVRELYEEAFGNIFKNDKDVKDINKKQF